MWVCFIHKLSHEILVSKNAASEILLFLQGSGVTQWQTKKFRLEFGSRFCTLQAVHDLHFKMEINKSNL